jgi:hypothetical protein
VFGSFRGAISRFIAESGFFMAAALAFWFHGLCSGAAAAPGRLHTIGFVLTSEEACAGRTSNQLTRTYPV